jgi:hypothetical protein
MKENIGRILFGVGSFICVLCMLTIGIAQRTYASANGAVCVTGSGCIGSDPINNMPANGTCYEVGFTDGGIGCGCFLGYLPDGGPVFTREPGVCVNYVS